MDATAAAASDAAGQPEDTSLPAPFVDASVDALSSADLESFLRLWEGHAIKECADEAAAEKIRAFKITVTVRPDGVADKFSFERAQFGKLAMCVDTEIGHWRFPRSPKGATASITITFP